MKMTMMVLVSMIASSAAQAAPFSAVRSEQVPSGLAYSARQPTVESAQLFRGKRVAILASHGVEEAEITFPYQYLAARGAQVDILVPGWTAEGIVASRYLKPTLFVQATGTFQSAHANDYDLVILTGGAWNAQVVRTDGEALALIKEHFNSGKPLAAICAGTSVLINAGIASGSRLTGPGTVSPDLINAGARFVDQPTVLDGNLLTSRSPDDLLPFVGGLKRLLFSGR